MSGDGKVLKWVGTRPVRPDGVDKVTGRAKYTADYLDGQAWEAAIFRSPYSHAEIVSSSKGVGSSDDCASTTSHTPTANKRTPRNTRSLAIQERILRISTSGTRRSRLRANHGCERFDAPHDAWETCRGRRGACLISRRAIGAPGHACPGVTRVCSRRLPRTKGRAWSQRSDRVARSHPRCPRRARRVRAEPL